MFVIHKASNITLYSIFNFARYRSQARRPRREEGGLSVGLATLPRQKASATESFVNNHTKYNLNHTDFPRTEIITGYRQSSYRKAVAMMPPFLKVRNQYRIGFWNIRSLLQTGKLVQVSKEMDYYSINTLGQSECR